MSKLRNRLLARFLPLAMAPLLLTAAASLFVVVNQARSHLNERLTNGVAGVESEIVELKSRLASSVAALSREMQLSEAFETRDRQTLLDIVEQRLSELNLDFAMAIDVDGVVLAQGRRPTHYGQESDEPLIRQALAGASVVSLMKEDRGLAAMAVHPVVFDGQQVGALAIGRLLDHRFVAKVERDFGLKMVVMDGDRLQTTTFTDPAILTDGNLIDLAARSRQDEAEMTGELDLAGRRFFVQGRRIRSDDDAVAGVLLFALSAEGMYASIRFLTIIFALTALALAVLMFLMTWHTTAVIVRPIKALAGLNRRIAAGDLSARAKSSSKDEIGELTTAFNSMAADLERTTTSMEPLNQEVKERARAESELRVSETRLAEAQRIGRMGSFEVDLVVGAVWWSDELYRMLEFDPDRHTPTRNGFFSLVHLDDQERYRQTIDTAIADAVDVHVEYRVKLNSGEVRWLVTIATPLRKESGEVTGFTGTVQDITERRQAEDALRKNEERLDLAMSVNNDGMYDWDVVGNRIFFDPRYYTMAGYEPHEFPGTLDEWARRVHPEDFVKTEAAVKSYLAGDISEYDEEFRFERQDGEWMWIRARVKVVERDESGAPTRIVGTHTDITERKRAEDALRTVAEGVSAETGEAFFRSLVGHLARALNVDYAFVGTIEKKSPGVVQTLTVWAKQSFADSFSYDLTDTPCANVVENQLCVHASSVCEEFPRDELLRDMGVESYAGTPLCDSRGSVIGLLVVLDSKPMTELPLIESLLQIFGVRAAAELERVRAEQALRDSEERYRTLVQNAPEAIIVFDMDQGRMVDANENAERLFKLSRVELMKASPAELSPVLQPDGRNSFDQIRETAERVLVGEKPVLEWVHIDSEGGEVPCEIRLVRLPSPGRKLVRGSITDISERKIIEARQRRIMSELDHRVKNTLAAVLSLAEQTIGQSSTLDQFSSTFMGRIRSLARTHEALAAKKWSGVEMQDLVCLTVPEQAGGGRGSIHVQGDRILLPPEAASPLCMTLHELATNALKYGALSVPEGKIDISWRLDDARRVHITWIEREGPAIETEPIDGFGITLIRGFIEHELCGDVNLKFQSDGMTCELVFSLDQIAPGPHFT